MEARGPTRYLLGMYSIRIERSFHAAHAVTIQGVDEIPHPHDWRVRVTLEASGLDEDGLLCDFHDLETRLAAIIDPFEGTDLNHQPPFDRVNPSAENIAGHIARKLEVDLPATVSAILVAITEAPGCEARCRIDRS